MKMTTNDVLTRQNFITKLVLKNDNEELSKNLKVKVMAMRIEYAKVRKHFEEDLQEFVKGVTTEEFTTLRNKPADQRTEEETTRLQEIVNQINSEYAEYVAERGQHEETINNTNLNLDEFNEIVEVNAGNDVEINGQKLNSADFLEVLYDLFVEE